MKKHTFLLFIMTIVAISTIANATPPNAIKAQYDYKDQELNIIVQHPVTNPYKHFIKEVDIYKNGREVEKGIFDFQTSRRNQTMTPIKLTAVDGDKFRIVAVCNELGSAEKTIQVKTNQ